MTRSVEPKLNPAILVWARETAGLSVDEAAKKLGVKAEKLEQCERGDKFLTFNQLKTAANVYKRSLAAFLLPEPPEVPRMLPDFRSLENREVGKYSSSLMIDIRRAKNRRLRFIEIMNLLERPIPSFDLRIKASLETDPSYIAEFARAWLEVSMEQQTEWRGKYTALHNWIEIFEKKGVLVFQTSKVAKDEMIGLCISNGVMPIILLNGKYTPNSKVFTMMHELVHLMIGIEGVSGEIDESIDARNGDYREIEFFCNRVAAEILVPKKDLENRFFSKIDVNYDDQLLQKIANTYSVSLEVALRRLKDIGRVTDSTFYQSLERIKEGYVQASRAEGSKKTIVPHFRMVLRDNGKLFTSGVVEAFDRKLINSSDFGEFLGTNIGHYGDIKEASKAFVSVEE
ncbi:helix-turn-helix domain-containing protein [Deinococcus sp. PEB2-63]